MKIRSGHAALLLALFLATGAGNATPQTGDVPLLGTEGTIDSISLKRNTIVVMDLARTLAPGYTVVGPKGKVRSAFNLKPGTPVRLELDAQGRVKRIIMRK